MEARAQLCKRGQRVQSAARIAGEQFFVGRDQIAIRFAVGTSHASAQLVQIRQTIVLCRMDDDCIHIRNIHTRFDNRGRDENIVVVVDKRFQAFFHFARRHLSVCNHSACFGTKAQYSVFNAGQHLNAVANHIYLSVALHLQLNSLFDDVFIIERNTLCHNGIAIGRWGVDDAQIACTKQRELQGTRNRCGGQCQYIYVGAKGFEFLFDSHAKLLFFVNDEQSEIFPQYLFAHQLVCTHQYVYFSVFEVGEYLFYLFGRFASAEVFNPHREIAEAFAEGVVVLHSEHGSGHQYCHLLAIGSCLEGSAHRHFGLTKTHIAADKAVHWHGAFHIVLDVQGGFGLVGGVFVEEGRL